MLEILALAVLIFIIIYIGQETEDPSDDQWSLGGANAADGAGTDNTVVPAVDVADGAAGTDNTVVPVVVETGTDNTIVPVVAATGTDNTIVPPVVATGTDNTVVPAVVDTTTSQNCVCSYEKEHTDKYRCVWNPIKHYAKGPIGIPPKVPEDVMNDCNNDPNCKFVYANGQNLYTCGPADPTSGYDIASLPRWNKKCEC
jgi:hypothetical protein